jgi:hypothetical protein
MIGCSKKQETYAKRAKGSKRIVSVGAKEVIRAVVDTVTRSAAVRRVQGA